MAEKRLIDANKVINAMQKCLDEDPDKKGSVAYFAFESIIECLKQEPTVDAVEVVRCKDCMWSRPKDNREPTDTPRELICQCFKHHHIPAPWGARMAVNTDDFCSYGERKDGDGNG